MYIMYDDNICVGHHCGDMIYHMYVYKYIYRERERRIWGNKLKQIVK